ncbi:MAG: hypothetical protein KBF74_06855 [Ferruginibacter sp.]|nr:hypothetical protein [Ferruginibacter sp.]
MKKVIVFLFAACVFITSANAQGGGQRQTPEERAAAAMEKMAPLNLDSVVKVKTNVIITDFFQNQQKAFMEMRESGNVDREAMMAKRKELAGERDAKLKLIFTEAQMKKWVDEIEPSLRPQRPQN